MKLGINRKQWIMVIVLLMGTLLAVLNMSVVTPALPSIMKDLGVDSTTVQWLSSGYSLVEAIVIPLAAFLMGRFSTRRLFIGCISLFAAGSLVAAFAPTFPLLMVGRVLQALCTGAIMPMVTAVILLVFPKESRGTAMGITGLVVGFAPALGPSISGVIIDSFGWRTLFVIMAAVSLIVIALAAVYLRNFDGFQPGAFDPVSVLLSSVGLACLLYGLSTFTSTGNMALTVALIVIGVLLVAVFVRRQLKAKEPMLRVGILDNRTYAHSVIIVACMQAALMGCNVMVPMFIQAVLGASATASGLAMLPGALIGACCGIVSGRMFDKYGIRKVALPGLTVMTIGGVLMALLGADASVILTACAYTVLYAGLMFAMTPVNTWGINALDNENIGHAQSVTNTVGQIASSMGTALIVSISALSTTLAPTATGHAQSILGSTLAFAAIAVILAAALVTALLVTRTHRGTTKRTLVGQ
ncbi:DHA2 family efflux MFS transporter permease subunit [Bifidobacterium olomucense]|uniref:Multidrug transporter n=1 Tax=Bifidobacterium olomucense TaxID=2675324 RepID=A0A7Y0EX95_9BIFI|nr:multidrug transporter [Bifidobacterium sp. DSM 109959]